jgi:sucrose-6-phosphate hydrolase SacC (GH32 family)
MARVVLLKIVLVLTACNGQHKKVVFLETFDGPTYGNWEAGGTAFESGPAVETMGFLGEAHATSLNPQAEPAVGTLTSPPFRITRNSIHFLLGAREVDFITGTMKDPEDLSVQLVVEGAVVRSKVPDEFHAMFNEGWDVRDLKGKEARFRIVDMDGRMDAFIDVDHIIMNDIPVEGLLTERSMKVSASKLNIPVQEGAERRYMEILAGDSLVRAFDVELATGNPDYWVEMDLQPWLGDEVRIRTRQYFEYRPGLLDGLLMSDNLLGREDLYRETLRPRFHFSARRGWINDPNGLVYYDGEYHLYYQANPYGWDHSRNDYNKTWGHAVSSDLVHWKELPAAIHPDHLGSIYSGSAVVDHLNTTGFQTGHEAPIVAIYTSAGSRNRWSLGREFTQSIVYSNDRGRTFSPYRDNPVQENLGYINRDPKAFWYDPGKNWVIVLYLDHGAFAFFTSQDLRNWQQQSILDIGELGIEEIAAFEDCPELFELPVDGNPRNTRWVLYAGSGDYVLGSFDGRTFSPETGLIRYNHGDCFYASQTFNNIPEADGRRIQMAWGTVDLPGMPFNQMMTFPVGLSLRSTLDGTRMFAWPVSEIARLRDYTHFWEQLSLGSGQHFSPDLSSGLLDVFIECIPGDEAMIEFRVNGRGISYDVKDHVLRSGQEEAVLRPENGIIRLRFLVDRVSAELYGNDGRIYMPLQTAPDRRDEPLEIVALKGTTKIQSLVVHELRSIW